MSKLKKKKQVVAASAGPQIRIKYCQAETFSLITISRDLGLTFFVVTIRRAFVLFSVFYLFVKYLDPLMCNNGIKGKKVFRDCKRVKENPVRLTLAKKLGILQIILVVQAVISLHLF